MTRPSEQILAPQDKSQPGRIGFMTRTADISYADRFDCVICDTTQAGGNCSWTEQLQERQVAGDALQWLSFSIPKCDPAPLPPPPPPGLTSL